MSAARVVARRIANQDYDSAAAAAEADSTSGDLVEPIDLILRKVPATTSRQAVDRVL